MKSFALVTFGTVIPTLALLLELVTGACGEVFFDPIPTWWHVGLVAFVPLANLLAATAIRADDEPGLPLIVCNGLALGIAAFYVVAMFEIIPLGFVGLLFFGAGTMPLSPLLSFLVAAALAGSLYRHACQLAGKTKLLWFLAAAAVGGVLALVPLAPSALTDAMVAQATRGTAEQRSAALRFLRRYGSQQEMLKLCYQGGPPIKSNGRLPGALGKKPTNSPPPIILSRPSVVRSSWKRPNSSRRPVWCQSMRWTSYRSRRRSRGRGC